MDYVTDQIVAKIIDHVKKKLNKSGMNIKPFQVGLILITNDELAIKPVLFRFGITCGYFSIVLLKILLLTLRPKRI